MPTFSDRVSCIERSFKVTGLTGLRNKLVLLKVGPLLVGDSAYPLSTWLMKPFKQTHTLIESKLRYNCALSRAQVVIEQAYRILKVRWRCLYKAMEEKTSSVTLTILASCVLHNICIIVTDPSAIDPVEDHDEYFVNCYFQKTQQLARNLCIEAKTLLQFLISTSL